MFCSTFAVQVLFNIFNYCIMVFSSTKAGHLAHIGATALLGQVANSSLVPPDPNKIENYGHLIIQAVVALVTIWATVRKAMQRPEEVVKVPAEALPLGKDERTTNQSSSDGRAAY